MQADARVARNYSSLDQLIQQIKAKLGLTIDSRFLGYEEHAIVACLTQRIALLIVQPFMDKMNTSETKSSKVLFLSGLIISPGSGKVKIRASKTIVMLAKFFAAWLMALIVLFIPAINRRAKNIALVYGVPDIAINNDIEEVCRLGPINELNEAESIHFQKIGKAGRINDRIAYHRFPLMSALMATPLSPAVFLLSVIEHFYVLFIFIFLVLKKPLISLLWQDFAFHSHAYSLNKSAQLKTVVFTNTNMLQQFLWMNYLPVRKFKTLMALYSLNSHYFVLKEDPVHAVNPGMRLIQADEILVWNEQYAKYLEHEGINVPSRIVAPVVWQTESGSETRLPNTDEIIIGIFDVTPLNQDYLKIHGLSGFYYSREIVCDFIRGVILLADNLQKKTNKRVLLQLKHKRQSASVHNTKYFEFIDQCRLKHKCFEVISAKTNVFDFISKCDFLVVIPYSSPAYIGDYMSVPSIYFDPTKKLLPIYMKTPYVSFVSDTSKLLESAVAVLKNKELSEK